MKKEKTQPSETNTFDETTPVEPVENSSETVENSQSATVSQSDQNTQNTTSSQNAKKSADKTTVGPAALVAELTNDLQRTRADFENFRKQVETQKSQAMAAAKYATVEKFLPLVDDFERALQAYPEQLAPLRKNLDKTLANLGLAAIDSRPGTEFNPDFHEAVSVEDNEGDKEIVAETLRPGYLYDGVVIRAAMVKVKHA